MLHRTLPLLAAAWLSSACSTVDADTSGPAVTDTTTQAPAEPTISVSNVQSTPLATAIRYSPYGAEDVAIIATPSGNINCALYHDWMHCGISSWRIDQPYGTDEDGDVIDRVSIDYHGVIPFATIDDYEPEWGPDMSYWTGANNPQIIPYDSSVAWGNFMCTSLREGLRCADIATGTGALINRDGYTEL